MAIWSIVPAASVMEADRFDGDYYKPDDLETIRIISLNGGRPLSSIASILTGRTPNDYDEEGSLSVVRSGDLVAPLIYPSCGRPFLKTHQSSERVRLQRGDVLISSIGMGSIGKISLVVDPTDLITVSEVTVLRDAQVSPEFLFAYLSSPPGQAQIERETTGATGQQHLLKSKVKRILVPTEPKGIKSKLQNIISRIHKLQEKGQSAYDDAEALLEAPLGLNQLDLSPCLFYEETYDSVQQTDRFDAEHFQPKYKTLLDRIGEIGPALRLGNFVRQPIKRGVQPDYEDSGNIPVINSQHVGKFSVDLRNNRMTSIALMNPKAQVSKYDVLLNSTGYITIGRCQALLEEVSAVVDGHISIIRPNECLDPVYLAAFLNSRAGFLQTEQSWTGSSGQIELRIDAISDFIIWQAPDKLQKAVRKKVEESFEAQNEVRRLLDETKLLIEKAIL